VTAPGNSEPPGRVLVTGAAGLIGHAVAAQLAARGTDVVAIDRRGGEIDGVPVAECDIADTHQLYALARPGLDAVVHCAAYSGPMVARDSPYALARVNVLGTANLLELARRHGARRFAYASSCSVYGTNESATVTESAPLAPENVYGATKAAGELLVAAYDRQYRLAGVSIRLSWVYGPRRATECVVRTMLCDALDRKPTRLGYGADFHRQFIHVDDAARALIAGLDAGRLPQACYNASGGTRHTLAEVGGLVASIIPAARIEVAPGDDPLDQRLGRLNIDAIQRDLGYAPRVPLADGLAAYAVWLSRHR
jgi:UDP-glucuronate 4-epimerase